MSAIDDLADAALSGDALLLRSITQDWLRGILQFSDIPAPLSRDQSRRAVAAGLVEMFAERAGQLPPPWTRDIHAALEPLFLLREARTMKRLRMLCEQESPIPLRHRRIYVPPDFLTFA